MTIIQSATTWSTPTRGRVGRCFLSELIQRRCEKSQADSVHQTSVVNRSRHRAFACFISYWAYSTNRQTDRDRKREREEGRHTRRRKQTDEQIGPSLKRYWACGACRCMEIRRTDVRTLLEWASHPGGSRLTTAVPSSPFNLHSCAIDHESSLSKREIDALQKWRRHSHEEAPCRRWRLSRHSSLPLN